MTTNSSNSSEKQKLEQVNTKLRECRGRFEKTAEGPLLGVLDELQEKTSKLSSAFEANEQSEIRTAILEAEEAADAAKRAAEASKELKEKDQKCIFEAHDLLSEMKSRLAA